MRILDRNNGYAIKVSPVEVPFAALRAVGVARLGGASEMFVQAGHVLEILDGSRARLASCVGGVVVL